MIVLAIKTDQPEAELAIYDDKKQRANIKWAAQRILADTINLKLREILNLLSISLNDIEGIVCFQGPGSFTGLRIGLSVGNALAYTLGIPIVATKGKNWLSLGIKELQSGKNQKIVTPYYNRPAATTRPKK